ncbi:MAG: winged helix-turn-helix domain-containing protein [Methanolobus sp.]|nr:winged helix-turn-helix domain-containing protein [Methanolobus sp.]
MKRSLLDVIFMSEKRKGVLLLLQDGAKEMEYFLKSLDTTRQALLPQIRILEDHYLVSHSQGTYKLTAIGKLIVDEMLPLLGTIEALDIDIDYWGTRNLEFMPSHILKRISGIKYCNIIKPSLANIYEVNQDFIEKSKGTVSLFFIFTFMHPSFPLYISRFIENDINTSIIITKDLLIKLKKSWQKEANSFIGSGKVKLFLYQNDLKFVSLSVSDHCLALRMLDQNYNYDNTQLFCCNPENALWGKELFEFYLKDSISITEI